MTTFNKDFMPQQGDYHKLLVYRKAECIYDITYHFAHKYLEKGDRTVDQMVQAARSGKQTLPKAARRRQLRARRKSSCTTWLRPACKSCWPTMRTI